MDIAEAADEIGDSENADVYKLKKYRANCGFKQEFTQNINIASCHGRSILLLLRR